MSNHAKSIKIKENGWIRVAKFVGIWTNQPKTYSSIICAIPTNILMSDALYSFLKFKCIHTKNLHVDTQMHSHSVDTQCSL